MNIGDFVKSNWANQYLASGAGTQATTGLSASAQAGLKKADQRIQAQVDTTTAQLSSFGKLKSSVSDAQIAARALGNLASTTSPVAQKSAASQFVSAFNGVVNTAKATAAVPGESSASLSASRTSKDLVRSVSADAAAVDALKKVGLSVNSDGTLALDAKKFDAAQKADPNGVRATLVKVGQRSYTTATKELGAEGNVGLSLSALNQRSGILKSQQATLASLGQSPSTAQSAVSPSAFSAGLAAYRNT